MQINISVRAILRAQAAPDAPILDNYFKRIASSNRPNGAPDHAERIAALPAAGGHKILVEAQAVAHQTRDPVVRVSAGIHASVAARAILQIQNQQALRFHQTLREELVDGDVVNHLHALLICGTALGGNGFEAGSNAWKTHDHVAKIVAGDSNEFDVIERGASGRSNAAAEEADFAEVIAAGKIGEDQFTTRIVFRNFHETDSNEIETIRGGALLNDGLAGGKALEFDTFLEVVDKIL
jgi:hypothetical protein